RHTRCYRDWSSDVCSSDLRFVRGAPSLLAIATATSGSRSRPVSDRSFAAKRGRPPRGGLTIAPAQNVQRGQHRGGVAAPWAKQRSEERRVGKEGRVREWRR